MGRGNNSGRSLSGSILGTFILSRANGVVHDGGGGIDRWLHPRRKHSLREGLLGRFEGQVDGQEPLRGSAELALLNARHPRGFPANTEPEFALSLPSVFPDEITWKSGTEGDFAPSFSEKQHSHYDGVNNCSICEALVISFSPSCSALS